jgi:uncharacterized protein (DUF1499 family)
MLPEPLWRAPVHTSRIAQLAILAAAISGLLFVGAPLLVKLDALESFLGFRLFLLGGALGLLALLFGLISLYTTRPAKGRAGRKLALCAALVGALVVGALGWAASRSGAVPPINDITTDFADPPQFTALAREAPNAGRDMSYPGEEFASQQRAGYPDLAPIPFLGPPDRAFAAAKMAIESFGWKVVSADEAAGTIEATDTSRIFRFVDDIVIRIRPQPTGAIVDMRSKSREGRGDLGANAARIRRLSEALARSL